MWFAEADVWSWAEEVLFAMFASEEATWQSLVLAETAPSELVFCVAWSFAARDVWQFVGCALCNPWLFMGWVSFGVWTLADCKFIGVCAVLLARVLSALSCVFVCCRIRAIHSSKKLFFEKNFCKKKT